MAGNKGGCTVCCEPLLNVRTTPGVHTYCRWACTACLHTNCSWAHRLACFRYRTNAAFCPDVHTACNWDCAHGMHLGLAQKLAAESRPKKACLLQVAHHRLPQNLLHLRVIHCMERGKATTIEARQLARQDRTPACKISGWQARTAVETQRSGSGSQSNSNGEALQQVNYATTTQRTWHGDDFAAHALQVLGHKVGGLPRLVLSFDAQHRNRLGADGNLCGQGARIPRRITRRRIASGHVHI